MRTQASAAPEPNGSIIKPTAARLGGNMTVPLTKQQVALKLIQPYLTYRWISQVHGAHRLDVLQLRQLSFRRQSINLDYFFIGNIENVTSMTAGIPRTKLLEGFKRHLCMATLADIKKYRLNTAPQKKIENHPTHNISATTIGWGFATKCRKPFNRFFSKTLQPSDPQQPCLLSKVL